MKECIINKHNVVLYDSIDELPMLRFHKYNKMLLVDAGVGSDLSDFDRHIEKVIRYLNSPTPNMATVELENMRQNIYFIQSEVSPRHLAFAVLVKSIMVNHEMICQMMDCNKQSVFLKTLQIQR